MDIRRFILYGCCIPLRTRIRCYALANRQAWQCLFARRFTGQIVVRQQQLLDLILQTEDLVLLNQNLLLLLNDLDLFLDDVHQRFLGQRSVRLSGDTLLGGLHQLHIRFVFELLSFRFTRIGTPKTWSHWNHTPASAWIQ